MYVAGNPIYFIDFDGDDIFIYYVGLATFINDLNVHTEIGAINSGNSENQSSSSPNNLVMHEKISNIATPYSNVSTAVSSTLKTNAKSTYFFGFVCFRLDSTISLSPIFS